MTSNIRKKKLPDIFFEKIKKSVDIVTLLLYNKSNLRNRKEIKMKKNYELYAILKNNENTSYCPIKIYASLQYAKKAAEKLKIKNFVIFELRPTEKTDKEVYRKEN